MEQKKFHAYPSAFSFETLAERDANICAECS